MVRNEGDRLKRVIVSTPGEAYFDVSTHRFNNIPELADRDRALRQHDTLKATMREFGAEVLDVPELPGHPNSVFPRDVALCVPDGHVKLRMGLEARRGEEAWMSAALDSLGNRCVGEIAAPGTVEGGDIILAGSVAFVGLSGRTNDEGARQLARLLVGMGYDVRTVPVARTYLHLGGVVSSIGPKRVLCCQDVFDAGLFRGFDTVVVEPTGPSSGNVICLGDNEVVANVAENEPVIREMERQGVYVHALDLSEFRKGGGGPTCLVLPVERG